jgi:hypothetical protein
MGIKMSKALDSAGTEWSADRYAKGKGVEPLHCPYCHVQVTHQSAHQQERYDKPVLRPAYFRLLPGRRHEDDCKHAVDAAIKTIANESHDIFETIRDGRYRLRLVMVRDALADLGKKPSRTEGEQGGRAGKIYERSPSKLAGYVNSATRVLKVRALCDADDEMAEHLELVFEGNIVVPWSQVYFETERYLDAYHNLTRNTVEYPIALHGTVKSKYPRRDKNGHPVTVLNLAKPKCIRDPDNPDIGISVEASVWCRNADWLADIDVDDEIVVFGMWTLTASAEKPPKVPNKYPYKLFRTHKLAIWPVVMAQIARVARKNTQV